MKTLLLCLCLMLGIGVNAQALQSNKTYNAYIDTDTMGLFKVFKVSPDGNVYEYDYLNNMRYVHMKEKTHHDGNVTKFSFNRSDGKDGFTETYTFTNDPITKILFVDVNRSLKTKKRNYDYVYGQGCVDEVVTNVYGPQEEKK